MPRLTKIYTRKGDDGYTNLADRRIPKDDLLVETIGTLDELNSTIGLVFAFCNNKEIREVITQIQNDLFDMGGELHFPQYHKITADKITWLEKTLDAWNETLPPLTEFVLPRGSTGTASCHVARTVCRRAERCLVHLHRQVSINNTEMLRYLNRLSDVLFVMARIIARENHETEKLWEHEHHYTK